MDTVSASTWIASRGENCILGASDDPDELIKVFAESAGVTFSRVPPGATRYACVWGVIDADGQVEGLYGGDAKRASARAMEIGGQLRIFLQP